MDKIKNKPCAFCGGQKLLTYKRTSYAQIVECLSCHGSAPADVWNRRSPMTEVLDIMESVLPKDAS